MPAKKPDPLAESLLAGLAQENADPDAADARFQERAKAIDAEDALLAPGKHPSPEGDGFAARGG